MLDFATYTKDDYEVNWHHRLLADHIDRFTSGEINRLMVFMPPRHGKSELVSRMLPAYTLGRNPDARIIGCSHTADLSNSMNRNVQRIMEGEAYRHLFPRTRLAGRFARADSRVATKRTTDLFEVVGRRGYLRSVGVGGAITGMGFDVGIIDDPIKSREEADSPTYREKVWQWYTNDFYSRRQHGAKILITLTRWHRDDLAGRLLRKQADEGADKWTVLSLPGLAKSEKLHPGDPRAEGEALWPASGTNGMDAADHRKTREQDPRSYAALYDQDPTEAAGAEWPPSYLGPHVWCPVDKWPELANFKRRIITVDPSKGKQDKHHDYSAIVFLGIHENGLLYVDASLEKRPVGKIVRDTLEFCNTYKPDYLGFEANHFQELLIDEFNRQTASDFAQRWRVYKIFSKINKRVRIINTLTPYLAAHEIRFRSDSPGCRLLVDQLIDFPLAPHDDGPDALEMALRLPLDVENRGAA